MCTGRVKVRVRVSDTGACRNGECRVTVRVGMVSVRIVLVGIVRVGMVTCTHLYLLHSQRHP